MTTLEQLTARVKDAVARGRPLQIRGGGSKDFYGEPASGTVLDTRGYCGVTAYEPTELYATARCGTPLAELETALAQRGQMLAFEPPHYGPGTTVGGMVAAGLSGPRRVQAGALREFVLGVQMVDGTGELLRFGGRVIKNVAGYDVSRLMAGSLGTLGLIADVTLKVLPRPAAETTLRFELEQEAALARLNQCAGKSLPISASAWHAGVLTLRLSGSAPGIAEARGILGGEMVNEPEAALFWKSLRDQTHPHFAPTLWRIAVPRVAPPLPLPGEQLIEWGSGLRWLRSHEDAAAIRSVVAAAGGNATLFRASRAGGHTGVFHPLPPAMLELQRRIKRSFDPQGIFNPGRMYAGL